MAERAGMLQQPVRLVVDATGFLHGEGMQPEKSWRQLDARHMAHAFAVNAIGPALLMKHFLPLLPREGGSVFATLSAKVGSIGDNRLGGWYSYRASKAALNQLARVAAFWAGVTEANVSPSTWSLLGFLVNKLTTTIRTTVNRNSSTQ